MKASDLSNLEVYVALRWKSNLSEQQEEVQFAKDIINEFAVLNRLKVKSIRGVTQPGPQGVLDIRAGVMAELEHD